jgi:hypothetical protein
MSEGTRSTNFQANYCNGAEVQDESPPEYENYNQDKSMHSPTSNEGSSQLNVQTNTHMNGNLRKRVYGASTEPLMEDDTNYVESGSPEKLNGPKRQMLDEITFIPVTSAKHKAKPKRTKMGRFGVDEATLRRAEEESELLDSLIEMSERQLQTHREVGERERNDNGLLANLLEDGQGLLPFNFDSI